MCTAASEWLSVHCGVGVAVCALRRRSGCALSVGVTVCTLSVGVAVCPLSVGVAVQSVGVAVH